MPRPTSRRTAGHALSVGYEHSVGTDFSLRGDLAGAFFHGGNDQTKKQSREPVRRRLPTSAWRSGSTCSSGCRTRSAGSAGWRRVAARSTARRVRRFVVVGGGLDPAEPRLVVGLEARLASFGGDITVFTIGLRGSARAGVLLRPAGDPAAVVLAQDRGERAATVALVHRHQIADQREPRSSSRSRSRTPTRGSPAGLRTRTKWPRSSLNAWPSMNAVSLPASQSATHESRRSSGSVEILYVSVIVRARRPPPRRSAEPRIDGVHEQLAIRRQLRGDARGASGGS